MIKNKKILSLFYSFAGGLLYASAFPIKSLFAFAPGSIIGITLLFKNLSIMNTKVSKNKFKSDITNILLFSLGYCILGYYWIPKTLETFGDIPTIFSWILGILFSLIIAPQYIVFAILLKLFSKHNKLLEFIKSPIILALILTLLEYFTPQQFPAHIGHSWLHLSPFVGLAPYLGAPFFSFINFWFVISIINYINNKKNNFYFLSILLLVVALNSIFALKKYPFSLDQKNTNIRLVQANIGNFLKLNSEKNDDLSDRKVRRIYEELSLRKSHEPIDLIIWPETAFPPIQSTKLQKLSQFYIPTLIRSLIKKTGSEIFIGGYDKASDHNSNYFETQYNTAFLYSYDEVNRRIITKNYYHKMKLIPFGETLPFGPLNPFLSKYIKNISYFAKGERYSLFETRQKVNFISAICYEILFSSFIRTYLNSVTSPPHFIINLTNDSWYGDTSEPLQHLFLSKWRSIEFQIPIVRMTNTGISSILYPDGSESERIPIFARTVLDHKLKTGIPAPTFFQRFGILITIIVASFLYLFEMLLTAIGNRQSAKRKP